MSKHLLGKVFMTAVLAFILFSANKTKAVFGETISGSIGLAGISEGLEAYYDVEDNVGQVPYLLNTINNYPDNIAIANVNSWLNIRQKAGTGNAKVGILYPGAAVEIKNPDPVIIKSSGENEEWYEIKSGKLTGFVSAKWLITGQDALDKADEIKSLYAVVNKSVNALNVRRAPSKSAEIISQVKAGEKMAVSKALVVNRDEDTNKLWVEIIIESDTNDTEKVGYVALEYVYFTYELQWAEKYYKYGTAVSDVRVAICEEAMKYLGIKVKGLKNSGGKATGYLWGGNDPYKGVDCSGFVRYVYEMVYKNNSSYRKSMIPSGSTVWSTDKYLEKCIPRVSADMQKTFKKITRDELQPGDLVFYANKTKVFHVAIYLGKDDDGVRRIIHSSTNTLGIGISDIDFISPYKMYYGRIIKD